jgi:hypothetical protein
MKVTCVDDKNRPNEIPSNRWIKKGEKYTITTVVFMKLQNIYGCKIAEINNDDLFPYKYFALSRFGLSIDVLMELINTKEIELEEVMS